MNTYSYLLVFSILLFFACGKKEDKTTTSASNKTEASNTPEITVDLPEFSAPSLSGKGAPAPIDLSALSKQTSPGAGIGTAGGAAGAGSIEEQMNEISIGFLDVFGLEYAPGYDQVKPYKELRNELVDHIEDYKRIAKDKFNLGPDLSQELFSEIEKVVTYKTEDEYLAEQKSFGADQKDIVFNFVAKILSSFRKELAEGSPDDEALYSESEPLELSNDDQMILLGVKAVGLKYSRKYGQIKSYRDLREELTEHYDAYFGLADQLGMDPLAKEEMFGEFKLIMQFDNQNDYVNNSNVLNLEELPGMLQFYSMMLSTFREEVE